MSRIGKKPVLIPEGVEALISGQKVRMKGPRGELSVLISPEVSVCLEGGCIFFNIRIPSQRARSMWGLARTLVFNIVCGVTKGFSKILDIQGVGYRAQVQGHNLQLNMGYSHEVLYVIPKDVQIVCTKPTEIIISGIDVQRVGQVAAEIRSIRPPEPYKGKGIRCRGEHVFRKEGKKK
ncbi:MAG: 50S ribosomal protein L6 [Alphaproteobacteria bacterium]|nr:50S ribosomal protein L6 [Alphaproteobacteria bacterium]